MFLSRLFHRRQREPQQQGPPASPPPSQSGPMAIVIHVQAPAARDPPQRPATPPPPRSGLPSPGPQQPGPPLASPPAAAATGEQAVSAEGEGAASHDVNHRELITLLSSPLHGPDRVRTIGRLLDSVRRLEAERQAAGPSRERPLALFISLALHELDAIVDSLSYEELWEAFGGHALPRGLHDSAIKALPTRQLNAVEAAALRDCTCPVCQEPFSAAQTAKGLPACSHTFHATCIDSWIRIKADCPVCRQQVSSAEASGGHVG